MPGSPCILPGGEAGAYQWLPIPIHRPHPGRAAPLPGRLLTRRVTHPLGRECGDLPPGGLDSLTGSVHLVTAFSLGVSPIPWAVNAEIYP